MAMHDSPSTGGKVFRILSIDGGGIRGIIPALILQKIEKEMGKPIHELFDLIAGTSTGGLISAGLCYSKNGTNPVYTTNDILEVYRSRGKDIFPSKGKIGNWWRRKPISYLFRPQFRPTGLQSVLTELFGEARLSDSLRPLLIGCYDATHNTPLFFKSRYARETNSLQNPKMVDVCRATSAAPTYLPPYQFRYHSRRTEKAKQILCLDGGVCINNPAMAAIAEVSKHGAHPYYLGLDQEYDSKESYPFSCVPADQIFCLSVGTGYYQDFIHQRKSMHWGKLNWLIPSLDILMWGNAQVVDYQGREMLRTGPKESNYHRIQCDIDVDCIDLADTSDKNIAGLEAWAHKEFIENEKALLEFRKFADRAWPDL